MNSPETSSPLRLNLCSGPRNISTALMYAFAQRADARVVDEPLYGVYLHATDADRTHPGAREVLSTMETDASRVIDTTILGPCDRPVLFLKQMAHHLAALDGNTRRDLLAQTTTVLLTRDPAEMLPSLAKNLHNPTLRDTGLDAQITLLEDLRALNQAVIVLDARQTLLDPHGVLSQLCERVGIPFDEEMLSWPADARPEDGVWAKYWYHNLHRSTGFAPYQSKTEPLPHALQPLLEECRPLYAELAALAIKGKIED